MWGTPEGAEEVFFCSADAGVVREGWVVGVWVGLGAFVALHGLQDNSAGGCECVVCTSEQLLPGSIVVV